MTASPNGGTFPTAQELTLDTGEQGSDIYYTLDGTDPIAVGGGAAEGASLHRPGSSNRYVHFAAIDPSGNVSARPRSSSPSPTTRYRPHPPSPEPRCRQGNRELAWAPRPRAGLTITGYTVQAYTAGGTAFGSAKKVAGDVTSLVYDGLSGDTQYRFTVRAVTATVTALNPP